MKRRRKKKYGTLKRNDHLLDMSPAGRNIFVSKDKQMTSRAANRIKMWMKIVMGMVIAALCAAGIYLVVFYMAPWLRSEMNITPSEPDVIPEVSEPVPEDETEYDAMGLPIYETDVCLFVVNDRSPAEKGFKPALEEVGGVKVDSRIAPALRLMISAAKDDGLALVLKEGYITYSEQEKRYEKTVEKLMEEDGLSTVMARAQAAAIQPKPGESDFQSGMCIRLDGNPESFEDSRTYTWLKSNMGKFGFVFRYPKEKSDIIGVNGDSTVIRYVGGECATAMQQRSMCLEEYINYLDSQ